jgi:predicted N-formylglutamate amidohydrolase
MGSEGQTEALDNEAVEVVNAQGHGRIVIACDHASNFIPAEFENLGLPLEDLERHIAWDPGARPVALAMSKLLDAPLVCSRISRLVIDCNRPLSAPDLVPPVSETTEVPGNRDLGADDVARRAQLAHAPFHAAIDRLLIARERAGMETWLISVHSFTPVYKGVARPWHVGILHDSDERLSKPLLAGLAGEAGIVVGDNQPYSPADRVYYTLERHARSRGWPCAMIEIRNDEIADEDGQTSWAERLAGLLQALVQETGTVEPVEKVS